MFGENLKKYRTAKGLSQSDVAEKLYVSRQCVSKWEKGVTQPDLQTLKKLSELLEVSSDELLDGGEASASKNKADRNFLLFIANILTAVFCLISFVIVWRFMPQTIPAHFSHGEIDRYGSRNEIFLNAVATAALFFADAGVFIVYKRIKENRGVPSALNRFKDSRGAYIAHGVILALQIAFTVFITVIYAKYLTSIQSFATCMCANLTACLSVAIHPKICGQNSLLGVRTADTLKSERVWDKTNALACYLFTILSAIIIAVNTAVVFYLSPLTLLSYIVAVTAVIIYSKAISKI